MTTLALGTVQFGLPYGVANETGQVSPGEASAILQQARQYGIDTLDTAIAYGASERTLGEIGVAQWRVVTKLPAMPATCLDATAWVRDCVQGSLERLRIRTLHGLLLHRAQDLLGPRGDALYRGLAAMKEAGCVGKIGVSVYGPEELEALWPHFVLDLVQAPYNVVDRRLASSGWLARLHASHTEVHVRSIFLQGLLLMDPDRRPARFAPWQSIWEGWRHWLAETSMTPLQACLRFALSRPEISHAVVGVDGRAQLQEILSSVNAAPVAAPECLTSSDPELINPLRWISP